MDTVATHESCKLFVFIITATYFEEGGASHRWKDTDAVMILTDIRQYTNNHIFKHINNFLSYVNKD